MANIIIFGCQKSASIAHHYLTTDSDHTVVAFCVHSKYLPENKFLHSLPIVAFESVESTFPTDTYRFFAPFTSGGMNTIKEQIYSSIKMKGYKMISFISSKASINNATVGDNCFIQEFNIIQPFAQVGNNVMIWGGNIIGHDTVVEDHVTITSNVVIASNCVVGDHSFLGIGTSIRNNVTLAKGTLVGMGSNIMRDTKEWSVYMGNPAKKIGGDISKSILNI